MSAENAKHTKEILAAKTAKTRDCKYSIRLCSSQTFCTAPVPHVIPYTLASAIHVGSHMPNSTD